MLTLNYNTNFNNLSFSALLGSNAQRAIYDQTADCGQRIYGAVLLQLHQPGHLNHHTDLPEKCDQLGVRFGRFGV